MGVAILPQGRAYRFRMFLIWVFVRSTAGAKSSLKCTRSPLIVTQLNHSRSNPPDLSVALRAPV
jgi:hypothetical protein